MFLRLYNAARKYLIKDTFYFFLYCLRHLQKRYAHNARFLENNELIKMIESGKSILRLGDGEISIIHYLTSNYQPYDSALRSDLLHIISNYSNEAPYVLGIPIHINMRNDELDAQEAFKKRIWMPFKITYEMIFNKQAFYFDAFLFYRKNNFEQLILPYLKTKQIIFVSHKRNCESIKDSPLSNHIIAYIESPAFGAYQFHNAIAQGIRNIITQSGQPKNNFVTIMLAGMSKIGVIPRLSQEGCQILDIGRGLEGYLFKENLERYL